MSKFYYGTPAILSNIDDKPKNIYLMDQQEEEIEQFFDAMKNELENDKLYLSDDDSKRGVFLYFIRIVIHMLLNICVYKGRRIDG